MAGDWMKIEKVTPDKPEIEGIANALDLDPDAVFGKCFRLWRWFDDHTTDGNAPSVTRNSIDRRVGVTGFASAMESVGWLVVTDSGVSLPKFGRHNGETSKSRALTAKRVASHKSKVNANGNGEVTVGALPREEKRREEKEIKNAGEANGNHGPRPTFLTGRSESFNRFLEAYPRRTSPELAWEVWQAKTLQLAEVNKTTAPEIEEMLIRAAAEYALAPAGQPPNSGEDYRPSPGNWLLGHKFEEDRAEWQQANGKQPKGRGKSKKATAEIEDFFAKRGL